MLQVLVESYIICLLYVGFSFSGQTKKCPLLAFDVLTFQRCSPSAVSACPLEAFSLKCITAS